MGQDFLDINISSIISKYDSCTGCRSPVIILLCYRHAKGIHINMDKDTWTILFVNTSLYKFL